MKVVSLGGGTGQPVLLKGLKKYTQDITAIVGVADSGCSSGTLREEFNTIPPRRYKRLSYRVSKR